MKYSLLKTCCLFIVSVLFYSFIIDSNSVNQLNEHTDINSLNQWLHKSIGFNPKLNILDVSFNTKNYDKFLSRETTDDFFPLDVSGENLAENSPIIKKYPDHIELSFKGSWYYTYYANEAFFIESVHHGSSGESKLLNLITGKVESLDFEIIKLRGNIATYQFSWHDNQGGYRSEIGSYDLISKQFKKFNK